MQRADPGRHRSETALALVSLAVLVPYVPGETWLAWGDLTSPGYLVDVLAWLLLGYGAVHSLRRRPRPAAGPLCGAWGFVACLGWRTYFARVISKERGLPVYEGEPAFVQPLLGWCLPASLAVFAWCLWLARAPSRADERRPC